MQPTKVLTIFVKIPICVNCSFCNHIAFGVEGKNTNENDKQREIAKQSEAKILNVKMRFIRDPNENFRYCQ